MLQSLTTTRTDDGKGSHGLAQAGASAVTRQRGGQTAIMGKWCHEYIDKCCDRPGNHDGPCYADGMVWREATRDECRKYEIEIADAIQSEWKSRVTDVKVEDDRL